MGKINVLSFAVANLIAAGEVVDRPASVVKELIENSIDAGATRVTVEIQNGGVTLLRVSDNGCGMEKDDLPIAIRRHATSKIRDEADLDGILTLGFRGEALAATCAVSNVRIISKPRDASVGAMLEVHHGNIVSLSERGASDGTTVIVEDLFSNVPARRKFLKKDVTEAMAVTANVEKIAISHPEIAVSLIIDGHVKVETAGDGNLKSAIWAVFGREFASKLIPVNSDHEGVKVSGFIGRTDNCKANRNYENFFINQRYVKSRTAMAAVEQAYVSYVPQERFPVCVLFLEMDPRRVDVNVHPAKLEVKFSNEKPVFEAIYYAVRTALEQNVTRPEMKLGTGQRMSDAMLPVRDGRGKSVHKLQLRMTEPPSAEKRTTVPGNGQSSTAFDHVTAEEYRAKYMGNVPGGTTPSVSASAVHTAGNATVSIPPLRNFGGTSVPAKNEISRHDPVAEPAVSGTSLPGLQNAGAVAESGAGLPNGQISSGELLPDAPRWMTDPSCLPTAEEYLAFYVEERKRYQESGLADPCLDDEDDDFLWEDDAAGGTVLPVSSGSQTNASEPDSTVSEQSAPDISADGMPECSTVADQSVPEAPVSGTPDYRIIGEAFHSYVLVETGEKLLVIDKHAAHERIIFERLKANMRAAEIPSQMLMLPVEVMLMTNEIGLLEEYRGELESVGFSFRTSRNTAMIDAIPDGVEPTAVGDMLAAIVDRIKCATGSAQLTRDIVFEKALYQASCKAAIKAGRDYPAEHLVWLVGEMMKLPDITFCPHGRPVAMELTKKNLDHQFERT